jgi:N-acetylglucosaminyldiphosphoundecaprenol N-acetyl-beta-D-mannosaminyltransferase
MTKKISAEDMANLPNLTVSLLGRRMTLMTLPAVLEAISRACADDRKITVAHYNTHSFNFSMQLPWFYEFLQNSEIVHCDGVGILKALRYLGVNLPLQYRVSYSLLMPELLEQCQQNGLSMFLLGSNPQNLNVAVHNLSQRYSHATFSGYHGYFSMENAAENQQIIQMINRMKPNILVVGMGMPRQEEWVWKYRDQLEVNAILVGGAVIDRLAGKVADCPAFIADRGLEWLYRLMQEPKRLAVRYLLGNPAFFLSIALAKFSRPQEQIVTVQTDLPQPDLVVQENVAIAPTQVLPLYPSSN